MKHSLATTVSLLPLEGGLSQSVFPQVEKWVYSKSDHAELLQELVPFVEIEYQSLLDLLFCESYRDQQEACLAFYEGKGPPLRELCTGKELQMFERGLLLSCKLAYERVKKGRFRSWEHIAGLLSLTQEK